MGKRLFFGMAAVALLLLQVGNCMPAMAMNSQAMQCCRSMPCTPANSSQGCCKNMVSRSASSMLPGHHGTLHGPAVANVDYPVVRQLLDRRPETAFVVDAQQHSPPDLCALHSCLLI